MSLKIFLVAASALALNVAIVHGEEPTAPNTLVAATSTATDATPAGGGGGHPVGGGGHPVGGGGHPVGGGGHPTPVGGGGPDGGRWWTPDPGGRRRTPDSRRRRRTPDSRWRRRTSDSAAALRGGGGHPTPVGGGGHPTPVGGGGHPTPVGGGGHPTPVGGGGHPTPVGGGGHPTPVGGGGHPTPVGGGGHPTPVGGGGHPTPVGGGGHPTPVGGGGHPTPVGGGGHPTPVGGFPGGWHPPTGQAGEYHPISGGFVGHNGGTAPTSHWDHVTAGLNRMTTVMHANAHVEEFVNRCGSDWQTHYAPIFAERGTFFDHCYADDYPFYRDYWGPRYWFWGWGWRSPVIVIDDYFWNPAFFWFYADDTNWDDAYFQTWYGPGWAQYPHLHDHFRWPRVFYATGAWAELTVGVSDWQAQQQLEFRDAMTDLIQTLNTDLSQDLGTTVTLSDGSVEIDHYQILATAVVFDGSVTFNNQGYPFRAYIDLANPANSNVFVTTTTNVDQPTAAQATALTTLNNKVTAAGGILESPSEQQLDTGSSNPTPAPAPQGQQQLDTGSAPIRP